MKKTVFTLNVNGYSSQITEITFPLMRYYARKIGAAFRVITERKFPDWPVVCEKLQVGELITDEDWVMFFDADTIIHPDCLDWTVLFPDDVVVHNAVDFANSRHRYNDERREDGRHIGTCGWFSMTPKKCFGFWDLPSEPMAEILEKCTPTLSEAHSGITVGHLTDDYIKSENLVRYHLKHDTVTDLFSRMGHPDWGFFWHAYTIPEAEKVRQMKDILWNWKIPHPVLLKGWEWFHERMK